MTAFLFVVLLAIAIVLDAALIWVWRRFRRHRAPSQEITAPLETRLSMGARINRWWHSLDQALFGLSLAVLLATRLVGLENFPIYFFSDEAVNTVLAGDFIRNFFRDSFGHFFPTYFQNGQVFSLSVSVYVQIIPQVLFGNSVFVTRATSALIACSGTLAAGLILRDFFKLRFWWIGVLLLSITPAWFLHSRTAFETVLAVSFYAWFLYFYLRYRQHRPRSLFPALLFGALAFYTYNPMQLVVIVSGVLMLLSDLRYHWHNRRVAAGGLAVIGLLALPYLRFQAEHPTEVSDHLRVLGSYWLEDITLAEKLGRFWQEYTYGFSPNYWYAPDNPRDLIRHQMKGYGNILPITLPFAVVGAAVCLRKIRSSTHRAILIALIAAPTGGAPVAVHVTRVLVFVVPAALLAALGLAAVLTRLTQWVAYNRLALGLFALLCVINLAMLRDALANGPTWYTDYGLTGLQYGGKEVLQEVRTYLERSPPTRVWLIPTWLNGADTLLRFFVPEDLWVSRFEIDYFMLNRHALGEEVLLVVSRPDYLRIIDSKLFSNIRVEQTLDLPDRTTGFYFMRLAYSSEADAIFAAQLEARRRLIEEAITLDGETIVTRHSPFDIGRIQDVFDGDPTTLARSQAVNPAIIELVFNPPRRLTGIRLTTGSMDIGLIVRLFADADAEPATYSQTYARLPLDPTVDLNFDSAPGRVKTIRIEIEDLNNPRSVVYVHVREIVLR